MTMNVGTLNNRVQFACRFNLCRASNDAVMNLCLRIVRCFRLHRISYDYVAKVVDQRIFYSTGNID